MVVSKTDAQRDEGAANKYHKLWRLQEGLRVILSLHHSQHISLGHVVEVAMLRLLSCLALKEEKVRIQWPGISRRPLP